MQTEIEKKAENVDKADSSTMKQSNKEADQQQRR